MFNQHINSCQNIPINDEKRKITDIICIPISILLPLILFIAACLSFNKRSWDRANLFRDKQNRVCGIERNQNKQFMLFQDINNLQERQCLEHCPVLTFPQTTPKGIVCVSRNQQERQFFFQKEQMKQIWDLKRFKQTMLYTSIIALCLGIIWIVLFMVFPQAAPVIAILGSACILFILGQLIIISQNSIWRRYQFIRYLSASISFFLGVLMIIKLCFYLKQVQFQQAVSKYVTSFLRNFPLIFTYIPLFLLLMSGLVALFVWQFICFSFTRDEIQQKHTQFSPFSFWNVMNIIELIWGIQFLKDTFCFCVSGHSINYWFSRSSTDLNLDQYTIKKEGCKVAPSFSRLLCLHWGSVVGGSFLNAFFQIPAAIVELLTCHPNSCCTKLSQICNKPCGFITGFFDLVRTDSYSYIHITGIPYCNSCRQCSKLCDLCPKFIGYASPSKHYRRCASIFLSVLTFLLGMLILERRVSETEVWQLCGTFVIGYIIICFFVGVHSDICQAFQTCYLIDSQLGQLQHHEIINTNKRVLFNQVQEISP